jgi:hypothetical protein
MFAVGGTRNNGVGEMRDQGTEIMTKTGKGMGGTRNKIEDGRR